MASRVIRISLLEIDKNVFLPSIQNILDLRRRAGSIEGFCDGQVEMQKFGRNNILELRFKSFEQDRERFWRAICSERRERVE